MTFTWNTVFPGQVVDDAQNNLLGQTVQAHDALLASHSASIALMPYRDTIVLGSAQTSVTFVNIPSTLKEVRVAWTARGDTAAVDANMLLHVNGDSGANLHRYSYQIMVNAGAPAGAGALSTFALLGNFPAATSTAGCFGTGTLILPGWNNPHANWLSGTFTAGYTSAAAVNLQANGNLAYTATVASYTSLQFMAGAGNFIAGSAWYLEGLY